MSEPSFLSVAQRDRREEHKCPEGATERCERDFLRVAPCVGNSNAIPRESLSLCEAMDLTTASIAAAVVPLDMNRKHSEFISPECSDRSLAADVLLRQEPEEEEDDEEEDDGAPRDDHDDDEEDDGYSACLCFRGGLIRTGLVRLR